MTSQGGLRLHNLTPAYLYYFTFPRPHLLPCFYAYTQMCFASGIMSYFQGRPVDYLESKWAQHRSVQWMNKHTSISPGIAHIITPCSLCFSLWQILTFFHSLIECSLPGRLYLTLPARNFHTNSLVITQTKAGLDLLF